MTANIYYLQSIHITLYICVSKRISRCFNTDKYFSLEHDWWVQYLLHVAVRLLVNTYIYIYTYNNNSIIYNKCTKYSLMDALIFFFPLIMIVYRTLQQLCSVFEVETVGIYISIIFTRTYVILIIHSYFFTLEPDCIIYAQTICY